MIRRQRRQTRNMVTETRSSHQRTVTHERRGRGDWTLYAAAADGWQRILPALKDVLSTEDLQAASLDNRERNKLMQKLTRVDVARTEGHVKR